VIEWDMARGVLGGSVCFRLFGELFIVATDTDYVACDLQVFGS
jgi:hypothetical protein